MTTTFSLFQAFKNNLRSMAKSSNSVKPNLSLHNNKVTFIICTILEAHQNYHGYIVKVNAKTARLTVTYTSNITIN